MSRVYEHMIREPVASCGPGPAICVNPRTSVADAIALMKEHATGCVLVEESRRLAGIFTERDVLFRVTVPGLDPATTPVSSVMTPDPETLTMHDALAWVLNLMAVGGFRHVPIVDDTGRAIAIVSMQRIVGLLVECFPQAVLTLPPRPNARPHAREGA